MKSNKQIMTDNSKYEYMCEASIGERSKCTYCTKPLVDPVSTKCDPKPHIFCRHCIEECIERNHSCHMCFQELHTQDLIPITNKDLIDALNRILVKCVRCEKTGLERGHFHDHQTKVCPKADVLCSSSDMKCPWTGPRDQLDKHLKNCIFNSVRPLITQLQNKHQRLASQVNQQETQIQGLKNENQQLRDQTKQIEERLEPLELMCLELLPCSAVDNSASRWRNRSHLWRKVSRFIKSHIPWRNETKEYRQISIIHYS